MGYILGIVDEISFLSDFTILLLSLYSMLVILHIDMVTCVFAEFIYQY